LALVAGERETTSLSDNVDRYRCRQAASCRASWLGGLPINSQRRHQKENGPEIWLAAPLGPHKPSRAKKPSLG
jgi:hypothetical protein